MRDERIQQAIESAAASMKMEGFQVDEESIDLCRRLLRDEITMEEYISAVIGKKSI